MRQVVERYLAHLAAEKNASRYTVRNYANDLRTFNRFLVERQIASLDRVDHQLIRDYLAWLLGGGFAKASIARKLSTVREFFRYLAREGIIPVSPVKNISSPKLDKRLPEFLTKEQAAELVESPDLTRLECIRDRAMLELLYAAGVRVSELAGLDLDSVNLDLREVRVWGKGAKERITLMGEPAVEALKNYLSHARPELAGKRREPALFINRYGNRLSVRAIQRLIKIYAGAAGIDKAVHPHMVRHAFATHLLDGGADLRVVQDLLGHSKVSTTEIYTKVTTTQMRRVYLAAHPMARENPDSAPQQPVKP